MIYNPLNKRIIHTIVLFLFLFTQIDSRAESARHYSAARSAYMPSRSVCLIYGMGRQNATNTACLMLGMMLAVTYTKKLSDDL